METMKKQAMAQDVMNNIIVKCWEDENFKNELMANPLETLEKFTGHPVNLPEGKRLVVKDQSEDKDVIYLNIPAEPDLENLELTDEQLELVSGASTPVATYFLVVAAGVAVGKALVD